MDFLKIIAIIIGLPGGIGYIAATLAYEDPLFFMRGSNFQKKVRKNGYKTAWDLMKSLLRTSKEDWEFEGGYFVYKPFPGTTIQFDEFLWYELKVVEGIGKVEVFNNTYYNDQKYVSGWNDPITGKSLGVEESFLMEQVIFHVRKLRVETRQDQENARTAEYQEKEKIFLEKKESKKEKLRSLLEGNSHFEEEFSIRYQNEDGIQSLSVLMDGEVYYQAFQLQDGNKMKTTISHKEKKDAQVFIELEKELYAFAKKMFERNRILVH